MPFGTESGWHPFCLSIFCLSVFCAVIGYRKFDILVVIAEVSPENGEPADMLRRIRDGEPEIHGPAGVELQAVYGDIGELFIVHICAVIT